MGALSEEQRAAWRERMRSLSPEARERLRDSMMTATQSRRGGMGGGPRPGAMGAPGPAAGEGRGGDLMRRGEAGGDARGLSATPEAGSGGSDLAPAYRPGVVYVLVNGKPERIMLLSGITDGAFTEVQSDQLKPGDKVIVGMEISARSANLQPPPGMGGPQFRGPGGGGRR
jgi:hypothetical protein